MISPETRLMNAIIALQTKNHNGFPNPLYDAGFRLEAIEPNMIVHDADKDYQIVPELQLRSDRENHLLFIECKAGFVEKDQLERYKLLDEQAIKDNKLTTLDSSSKIDFDLMYFGTEEKEEKLSKSITLDNNPFPIVIMRQNKIELFQDESGNNKFKNSGLNNTFREIEFENAPISYVPFTVNDKFHIVAKAVLRQLGVFMLNGGQFTVMDLIKEIFGDRFSFLSTEYLNQLQSLVNKTLKTLRDGEMSGHLTNSGSDWTINKKRMRDFSANCEKLIEKFENDAHMGNLADWS